MKLNARALAMSLGIIWGVALLVITIISLYSGYAAEFLSLVASFYPGYEVSIPGAVIGLIYAFIDGFIGGYLMAIIYNKFAK